jgi:hypothetical protein
MLRERDAHDLGGSFLHCLLPRSAFRSVAVKPGLTEFTAMAPMLARLGGLG